MLPHTSPTRRAPGPLLGQLAEVTRMHDDGLLTDEEYQVHMRAETIAEI
jgi:hypothetical protein